ncbi:glutamate receptor ionotropic, NMDA 2B-like [Amphibalanus amphitrite]|uniref:glutamate receptor ionotropic, NMDA 2B-like n=1 Tax=Amphibalanus amphitrite TaxID=1232801 RepID=UPI001C91F5C9|nr:glutamate receptor ionotropic, NMDA 2B-like [Amphibalanus amphitrite]
MHHYMLKFNKSSVVEGIKAVKSGELDAFIYDATVLEYHAGQDDECRLLTVGQWYAMTGYGVGFPRNSKHIDAFNERIMHYRQNGDLERLHRFWFTGACRPDQQKKSSSNPLTLDQFLSTFLLLGCGILLSAVLLGCEYLYFRYVRPRLARVDRVGGCCSLMSLSMGRSLNFRGVVLEAQNTMKSLRRCRDAACDTQLWRLKHELQLAQARLTALEQQCGARGLPGSPASRRRPPDVRPDDIMDSNHVRRSRSAERWPPAAPQHLNTRADRADWLSVHSITGSPGSSSGWSSSQLSAVARANISARPAAESWQVAELETVL